MTDKFDAAEEFENLFKNAQNRTEQKQKMRKLMAQYGESEFDIENNAPMNEYMEFLLVGGAEVLEMVKRENAATQADYNPYSRNEDVIEEEEEEERDKDIDNDAEILKRIRENSAKEPV